MSLQNRYTQSIGPKSIDDFTTIQDFSDMMAYFDKDSQSFVDSLDSITDFHNHFTSIYSKITNKTIYDSRLEYHKKLRNNKRLTIDRYLNDAYITFQNEVLELYEELSLAGYPPEPIEDTTPDQQRLLETFFTLVYSFMGLLQGFMNIIFFGFESSVKILSSQGCLDFAVKFSNNQKINHKEVWNAPRRMSHIASFGICQRCSERLQCKFPNNFEAYSNCYAYVIKTRMLSDYSALFYSLVDPTQGTLGDDLNLIFKYFTNIDKIILAQGIIESQCLGW